MKVTNETVLWRFALLSSEGVWRASVGWRLGSECWELAVAFSKYFLSPVLQGLLPCRIRQEDRQKWRLHKVRSWCKKSQVLMNHIIISWNMCFLCFTFKESTFLSWRSFQLSISMSPGKPHAVSSRQQAALLVRTTHSRWYSTRSSARRTSRGWRWPMPRDPQTPKSRQAKSKVTWKTLN